MNYLTENHIAANELRTAAYHEAGHKILYERFGGAGDAIVWKNQSRNQDEAAWCGHFRPRTCPEVMYNSAVRAGFSVPELPANWRRLYSMAGLVAEEILDGVTDPAAVADTLEYRIAMGEASVSDLAGMQVGGVDKLSNIFQVEVQQCVQYLIEEWPRVQKEAEYAIADAVSEEK